MQIFPASKIQRQFWLLQEFNPKSSAYNIPIAFYFKGTIDNDALKSSINTIIKKHANFRTKFRSENNELLQIIEPNSSIDITILDTENISYTLEDVKCKEIIETEASRLFCMEECPLIRLSIFNFKNYENVLLIVMHHTISDLETVALFTQDLGTYYNNYIVNIPVLDNSSINQYQDYSNWENTWIESESFNKMVSFWKKEYQNRSSYLDFPTDYKRPEIPTLNGAEYTKTFDINISEGINSLCSTYKVNPFIILLSAYYILLHLYSKKSDISIGVPLTNRRQENSEKTMGCFANILPLPIDIEDNYTFSDIIKIVRKKLLLAHRNQEVPFEEIVNAIKPERNSSYNSLFQIGFTFEPEISLLFDNIACLRIPVYRGSPQLDIFSVFRSENKNIYGRFEYNSNLFSKNTIEYFASNFEIILKSSIENQFTQISAIDINKKHIPTQNIPHLRGKQKSIDNNTNNHPLNIAATFTAEPLKSALEFWINKLNFPFDINFAPYNQVFQELLDNSSIFNQNDTGVNCILLRFDDWINISQNNRDNFNFDNSVKIIEKHSIEFLQAVKTYAKNSSSPLLVLFCPISPSLSKIEQLKEFISFQETKLINDLSDIKVLVTISSNELNEYYPVKEYYEPMGEKTGHTPYSESFYISLATMIIRRISNIYSNSPKAVVLDCDNTLWKGIIGEDGIENITIGEELKVFQKHIISLKDRGILLCLCSKNNEIDVINVLDNHPEMVIRKEHIVAMRINWDLKSENIKSLAKELNIGIDSFVFIDDNPIECAEVQSNCPEVLTIQIQRSEKTQSYTNFINHIWIFDKKKITSEDSIRSAFYKNVGIRNDFLKETTSFADFIKGLELEIKIVKMHPDNLMRVSQLTFRTNQFNLSTIRRSETEIQQMINSPDVFCSIVTVKDRFGEYGLVGVLMYKQSKNNLEVDTFLLSCRALGKGVEHEMLSYIGKEALRLSKDNINLLYIPSEKNGPIYNFLENVADNHIDNYDSGKIYSISPVNASKTIFVPKQFNTQDTFKQPTTVNIDTQKKLLPTLIKKQLHFQASSIYRDLSEIEQIQSEVATYHRGKNIGQTNSSIHTDRRIKVRSQSTTENIVANVWKNVLHVSNINSSDNFFDIGGQSSQIPQIVIQLKKQHNISIRIVDIFQYPTLISLALHIDKNIDTTTQKHSPASNFKNLAQKQKSSFNAHKHRAKMTKKIRDK